MMLMVTYIPLGLGFSPWDILTIDLAAFAGNNDTIGAAIQFGFKV